MVGYACTCITYQDGAVFQVNAFVWYESLFFRDVYCLCSLYHLLKWQIFCRIAPFFPYSQTSPPGFSWERDMLLVRPVGGPGREYVLCRPHQQKGFV
jgi:hypothetical protein